MFFGCWSPFNKLYYSISIVSFEIWEKIIIHILWRFCQIVNSLFPVIFRGLLLFHNRLQNFPISLAQEALKSCHLPFYPLPPKRISTFCSYNVKISLIYIHPMDITSTGHIIYLVSRELSIYLKLFVSM